MEKLEPEEDWDEIYKKSKPIISYSILVGVGMDQIKDLVYDLLSGKDIDDLHIESQILSRMPEKDRHDYEFPEGINDFVFYDKFQLSKNKMKLEFVPLVLTSVDSKRKFAVGMKFYENIRNYMIVLKKAFKEEEESKSKPDDKNDLLTNTDYDNKHKYKELKDMLNRFSIENLMKGKNVLKQE